MVGDRRPARGAARSDDAPGDELASGAGEAVRRRSSGSGRGRLTGQPGDSRGDRERASRGQARTAERAARGRTGQTRAPQQDEVSPSHFGVLHSGSFSQFQSFGFLL